MIGRLSGTAVAVVGAVGLLTWPIAAMAEGALGYSWLKRPANGTIVQRFTPPAGYKRVVLPGRSFGAWLRRLPLRPAGSKVMLFNGARKANQSIHAAVIDIDVGRRDLQQCADAVMRLRAEYLYARGAGARRRIAFNYTSGDRVAWSRWQRGHRPVVRGRKVVWRRGGAKGTSRKNFRAYLQSIFTYAGTWSLSRELRSVAKSADVRAGDVFIQGGFPGHAVIVVDAARGPNGRRAFLLAQSFMPAQSIHVLKNPKGGVWYIAPVPGDLVTPEWTFKRGAHKRFAAAGGS